MLRGLQLGQGRLTDCVAQGDRLQLALCPGDDQGGTGIGELGGGGEQVGRRCLADPVGPLYLALRLRRRLARLAGVDAVGRLLSPGPVPVPDDDDAVLVEQALGQRLEMRTLQHQLEAAGIMIKIEKGARLPEVEANAQYFKQKAQFPSSDWLSLTLSLKVPVYDGGLAAARVAKAREDLFDVQLVERELRKGITDQVEEAAIGVRSATAALSAAKEREEASEEAHRQVERAYRAGEASATDLLTTTTELTDARTALIIARAQRQLQAIALRHALGEAPLPELELKSTEPEIGEEPS